MILSSTILTLSGCCKAFDIMFDLPNSTSIRSVPIDTRECVVRISNFPFETMGTGTSASSV